MFLPNTIYYENSEWGRKEFDNAVKLYCSHSNLYLWAREKISYEVMKNTFKNVLLAPDMVLYMDCCDENNFHRNGCLLCLREDLERTRSREDDKEILAQATSLFGGHVEKTTTVVPYKISIDRRRAEVNRKLDEFRNSELVITDRLHGMLFCAITGTPCIVINSKSHKILGGYEWIKHLPYIRVVNHPSEIGEAYQKIKGCEKVFDRGAVQEEFERMKGQLVALISDFQRGTEIR